MFGNFLAESCTGTTGTLTLTGAKYNHLVFAVKFSDGEPVSYIVEDADGIKKCGGIGTFNIAGTITRSDSWTWDGITYNDAPGGNLTLTAGTHTVRVAATASQMADWNTAHATIDSHLLLTDEHIDWSINNAKNIDPGNYTDTGDTLYVSSDFTHNNLSGVVANEHLDWTLNVGTIHPGNLPTLALTNVFTAANEAAVLALTAQEGDVAIQTDISTTFIHNGGAAGTMADWSQLESPTDAAVAQNTANRHTHSNKAVLDATTASFLSAQNAKLNAITGTVTGGNTGDNTVCTSGTATTLTGLTSTVAELNLLDLAGLTLGHVLSADSATTASWKAASAVVEVNDLSVAVTWANVPIANLPTGVLGTEVAFGNHTHAGTDLTGTTLASGIVTSSLTTLGTVTGFTSTGIDDNTTSTTLTLDASQNATFAGTVTATNLLGTNTGDNTVCTSGTATTLTNLTATVAELNLLDLSGLTVGHVLSADSATTASWKAQTGAGGSTGVLISDSPTWTGTHTFSLDTIFSGTVTATNLLGTNTGDQTPAEILSALKTVDVDGTAGVNAGTLGGQLPSMNADNNTIVQRNASGYIYANYANLANTFATTGLATAPTTLAGSNGTDTYGRPWNATGVRLMLNVADGATAAGATGDAHAGTTHAPSNAEANRAITDSVATTSSVISASATAVKAAYDRTWATVNNVATVISWSAGTTLGPVLNTDGNDVAIPIASNSASGVVNTTTQNFAGQKTFTTSTVFTAGLKVASNTALYLDGGSNTYLREDTIDNIQLVLGGTERFNANSAGIQVVGSITATGDIIAYSSDMRLKDAAPLLNCMDMLNVWEPIRYTWNDKAKKLNEVFNHDDVEVGLSAQSVNESCSELTSIAPFDRDDNGISLSGEDYLTINYARTVAVLAGALQEKDKEIQDLKSRMLKLEAVILENK